MFEDLDTILFGVFKPCLIVKKHVYETVDRVLFSNLYFTSSSNWQGYNFRKPEVAQLHALLRVSL